MAACALLSGAGAASATGPVPSATPTFVATPTAVVTPVPLAATTVVPGTSPTVVALPTARALSTAVATPMATAAAPAATVPSIATATAVPATAARASAGAWKWQARSVTGRQVAGNPTTCATTVAQPTTDCPVTMSLAATNLSAATTTFRVGDVVRVDVRLDTTATVDFNAVQVAMEFDAGELAPVTDEGGRTPVAPTTLDTTDGKVVRVASGSFGADATVLRNTYAVVGTGAGSGRVRLDAGVSLPTNPPGPTAVVTLASGTWKLVGSVFLRVLDNPPDGGASLAVGLRDSSANDGRFGLVAMVDADDGGINVLGPVQGTTLAVARTTVGARLAVENPATGTVRRIGDVVPVRVVLDGTTAARNARTMRATVSYDPARVGLVVAGAGAGANGAPPAFAASGTFSPDLSGSVFGPSATNRSTHALDATSGVVHLDVDGAPLALAAGSTGTTVATLHFRALDRGTLPLDLVSAQVGDASLDVTAPPDTVAFPLDVATVVDDAVAGVRGSVGVEVAAVGSPLAQDDDKPVPLSFDSTATGTFTVTDGRFLDVEVRALAGAADARQVDRFDIHLALPPGLTLPTDAASPTFRVLRTGIDPDGPTWIDATTPNLTGSVVRARLKTAGGSRLATGTPLMRLRLVVATSTFVTTTGSLDLAIAASTTLTQSGTRFVNDLHDSATAAPDKPLDVLPTLARWKPASLDLPLRLQGRSAADPDGQFAQDVDAFLAAPGAAVAATRQATVAAPAALAGTASGTMRYRARTARSASAATSTFATLALPDLDPGTYDLFVKGRSSLGARVARVTLGPGDNVGALAAPVTLLEGDADRSDAINIGDFVTLATTYASAAPEAGDTADFNQSGYVDAFDFSLLARNYAVRGPVTLATLEAGPATPTHLAIHEVATTTFAVTVPPGETLTGARISVTADARLGLACPASGAIPAGTTCTPDGASRVTLSLTPATVASGTVTIGGVTLEPTGTGAANLTAVLVEASGKDAAGATATYRAPSVTSTIVVAPDVTFALSLSGAEATAGLPAGLEASVAFTVAGGVKVTGGTVRIEYDATRLAVATPTSGATACAVPVGVTCDATENPGVAAFVIDAPDGLAASFTLGPVRLVAKDGAPAGTGAVHARVTDLVDGATDPVHLARALTAPPGDRGGDEATFVIDATDGSAAVAASRVRAAAVRARASRPTTGTWLLGPDGPVAPGEVVPVEIRLAAGVPVDAAQVVLRVGDGFEVVDATGRPADRSTLLAEAEGSPLPVVLRRAIDSVAGLVELAFGRQLGAGAGGATGDGRLGTILLRVPEAPGAFPGPALAIVPTGAGAYASLVVGTDGAPVRSSSTASATWIEVDAHATASPPVDLGPVASAVEPAIGPPAPAGAVDSGTGVARAPVAPGPRATLPAPSAPGARASLAAPAAPGPRAPLPALTPALVEDRARGTITVAVPGRAAPVELETGLATVEPDQYCPTVRHRTYVRLEDVGIAGATFGVEPGGVLAWVAPDQAGCVDWGAFAGGNLTFAKDVIMRFQLARAVPGALLWVLEGARGGELYEVDARGVATYVTAAAFAAGQDHFTLAWANVIPVVTAQLEGLAARGAVSR